MDEEKWVPLMEKYKKNGKYVLIFFGILITSLVIFIILREDVFLRRDFLEDAIYSFGTVIVLLLAYLIAQFHYLIDLLKKK
ncbi:hypothetical protein H1D32_12210 [Anaerobacillus sp. CMMVII]|uniref:hypothetical protein n=1 Tax=Anaerobacillus sp. CMMVII TaxID=2755588 RepID=UPI0021B842D9|nr:hypothetical protein [Anaerobacillus sp. CMMVII]MCT8138441.1 hypothetical protein [Anaerobacillus sp. CMMVII]